MALINALVCDMFGDTTATMLDGLFVEVADCSIQDDPDGVSTGKVLQIGGSGLNDAIARTVLPSAQDTVGIASRVWFPALPTNDAMDCCPHVFRNASNGNIVAIKVTNTGRLQARSTTGTGTLYGETTAPVIAANGWYHIETKVVRHASAGTITVRVNGVERLALTGLALGANSIAQLGPYTGETGTGAERTYYTKDFVWWDGSGTENNDFLGQVAAFWQRPLSTYAAGGWVSNAGADADSTTNKPRLANVLTASGAIVTTNQVRINNTYYNWTSGSVDAGSPAGTSANPWLVALGVDDAASMANMYAAIGATGTPGTTYSTALTAHTTVTPFGLTDTTIAVIPTDGVTVSMTFSETGANTSWLSTSAFRYLVHDAIYMSAGYTPAVAATGSVTFTGLPNVNDTVTIGAEVYTFKAARGAANEVTIGASATATGDNFVTALGLDSALVSGSNASGVVTLTALAAGTSGNSITLAESAANTTVSGATMTGGVNTIYPTAFEVALEPLPPDVTSIRAVIPVVRAAKIDGGDGNIQVSFGISVPSYDAGPDTALATAFTYYGNPTEPYVSEVNPLTASAWTPGSFNTGARIKVDRTL